MPCLLLAVPPIQSFGAMDIWIFRGENNNFGGVLQCAWKLRARSE